jgi:hypothetical protein
MAKQRRATVVVMGLALLLVVACAGQGASPPAGPQATVAPELTALASRAGALQTQLANFNTRPTATPQPGSGPAPGVAETARAGTGAAETAVASGLRSVQTAAAGAPTAGALQTARAGVAAAETVVAARRSQ